MGSMGPASAGVPAHAPAQGRRIPAAPNCSGTVWAGGTGGYHTYRIPAIVTVGNTLVAFAEARRNSALDNGDIDIVERRSSDGGCTWSAQRVIAADGTDTVDNPVPLVTADGNLVLVYNRQAGDVTQTQIEAGTVSAADNRRTFVQTSSDAGVTWSARREITSSVRKPEWRWDANGPGHGLTLENGSAPGRLVVAVGHSEAGPVWGGHLLLSDDDGRTWRIGASDDHIDGVVRPSETSAAELPDGRIYLSTRDHTGSSPENRAYTYSADAGESFTSPFRPLTGFTTPAVEASVLQDPGLPAGVWCAPLLYSGPEDSTYRRHMTVRRSDDDGVTWHTISELTAPTTPAAYSDMTKTSPSTLGVLYETGTAGPYERIAFATVPLTCP
jgi:sialidase-1